MVALWYGLMLLPFVVFVVLWWNYRRKQAAREQLADLRWKELAAKPPAAFGALASANSVPVATSPIVRSDSGAAGGVATVQAVLPSGARFEARARVLDAVEVLMLQLLRHALPDHTVLPRLPLDVLVLPVPRLSAEVRAGAEALLTTYTVDFTVCDSQWRPVAVIELTDSAAGEGREILRSIAAQAGIRYLRIPRDSLPRKEALRAKVLGEAAADTGAVR